MDVIGLKAILEDKNFQDGLKRFQKGIGDMESESARGASAMSNAWHMAGASVAIGAAAAAAGMAAIVAVAKQGLDATIAWGGKLDQLGDLMGTTGEESSAWAVAMERVGLTVEEGGTGLNYFVRSLGDLKVASADAKGTITPFQQALEKLGISGFNAEGKLRTFDELMPEILDQFQKLPPGVNASALAMDLFGARAGTKFLDFLRQGSAGLADAKQKAVEWGLSLSTDEVNAVESFGFAMNDLNLETRGFWNLIGQEVLPIVTDLVKRLTTEIVPAFLSWAREAIPEAKRRLSELWTEGKRVVTDFWTAAQPVLRDFKKWLDTDGVAALQTFFKEAAELSKTRDEWVRLFGEMQDAASEALKGVTGDANAEMPKLTDIIQNSLTSLNNVSKALLAVWSGLWKAAGDLVRGDFRAFGADMTTMLTNVMGNLLGIVGIDLNKLKEAFRLDTQDAVAEMQAALQGGITWLQGLPSQFWQLGADLIGGLVQGLRDNAASVAAALGDIIGDAIEAIKRQLGIASPSKVFAEMGAQMAQGLLEGFARPQVNFAPTVIERTMPLTNRTLPAAGGRGGGSFYLNVYFNGTGAPVSRQDADAKAGWMIDALRTRGVDL